MKTSTVLTVVVGLFVLIVYSDRIPRPATTETARTLGWSGVTVRLTGDVVAREPEGDLLTHDAEVLAPFTMSDPSGTLEVWYDAKFVEREVRKGRHVRLWGHFVAATIRSLDGATKDDRIFVATSLSVD